MRLVRQDRPDLAVEGPIQYDAAVDPVVAAAKIKGESAVAGIANVCIFPDLNTGNNTYKVRAARSCPLTTQWSTRLWLVSNIARAAQCSEARYFGRVL